ncbi:MAG: sucrose-specific PTS transporter subunit IIBC [Thomasclavelia sp.]|jgi:PTS system sucrose-specific IIC component|nr:sucrose-specific PTS transporter subunit IIBC [Thomasclavelia sp.]
MDHKKIANEVIENVGGKENIIGCMHCATRLRLTLKDESLIDDDKVASVEGVKGTFKAKGQYQIIFGAGLVNMICDQCLDILGMAADQKPEESNPKKEGNVIQRAVKTLSDIFVPIIPAIVAGGLLMGINNILTATGLVSAHKSIIDLYPQFKDLATVINIFANAPFTFLPVLIGFSATKKFGGNPFLGAAMGMIMVHPDLLNAYSYGTGVEIPTWKLFGLTVEAVGYQGTVLPVLGVSWILANIEKRLHKVTPTWLDNLSTPLVSIIVTGLLTFIVVGPVLREAGTLLADGISWMYNSLGFVGGGIFGLFYAPIVITGMHHSFIAIETQLIAARKTTGGSFIFPTASMSNVAQGSATLAVLFLTKDQKLKSLCSASGVSALLGITEPAMFGVTLKLKYPFYAACIGSCVGSAYLAGTKCLAQALGSAGIPGFLSMPAKSWMNFGIGMILSIAVAFVMTVILFKRGQMKNNKEVVEEGGKVLEVASNTVLLPIQGEVKSVSNCSDSTFKEKLMGDGVVINPTDGHIYAPFNGTVSMVFPTKHAIGLKSNDGIEVLIHCGIDTVNLEGKCFTSHVAQGDSVSVGELLMDVDLEGIKKAGYSTETPVIITNGKTIKKMNEGSLTIGDTIMEIEEDGKA